MVQKPESAVSLYELLLYLRNFFPGERWTLSNEPINGGGVDLPLDVGDYYLIEGSKRNDGLHIYGENDLLGDTLTGYVTECRIPSVILSIHEEINYHQAKYADVIASPFRRESYGGYEYEKESANTATGTVDSWQIVFASRLRPWRKI